MPSAISIDVCMGCPDRSDPTKGERSCKGYCKKYLDARAEHERIKENRMADKQVYWYKAERHNRRLYGASKANGKG